MLNEKIKELYLANKTYKEIAQLLEMNYKTVESRIRRSDYYSPRRSRPVEEVSLTEKSQIILTKLNVEIKDITNHSKLIEKFGFNSNEWIIKSAKFDEIEDGIYDVKLVIIPKPEELNTKSIVEALNNIKKVKAPEVIKTSEKNLVIPLFDLHFGNSTLEDYRESLEKIKFHIQTGYKKIVLLAGGDILNEDNYNGQTSSGTLIGKTDMTNAWLDCFNFFREILFFASEYSEKVELVYVPGNHDSFSGHTVLLALQQVYPFIHFDLEQEVYKAFLLDEVFIGLTHGHRSRVKNYPMIMATLFPKLWGEANIRECFTGHLHNEWSSKDDSGIMIRQMPSRNKLDDWHKEMGFVSSHKRFILAEYSSKEINSLHFV